MFGKNYESPLLKIITFVRQDVLTVSTCTTQFGDRANRFDAGWLG